jgi:hypothetical protein
MAQLDFTRFALQPPCLIAHSTPEIVLCEVINLFNKRAIESVWNPSYRRDTGSRLIPVAVNRQYQFELGFLKSVLLNKVDWSGL